MVIFILAILISLPIIWHFLRPSQRTTGKSPPEPSGAWPLIGHLPLLAGTKPPHLTLGNLADKYGPIFTIKLGVHQTLVISNSEMAKECLSTNDKAFSSRPKSLTNEILGYNYAMVGFTAYGPYWRQIRKVVALQLLSSYRLEKLRHVRETEVTEALRDLYNKWVKYKDPVRHKLPVDLKGFFYNITMNTILKIIVGKRYIEYEGNGEDDQRGGSRSWSEALGEFLELSGKISVSDSLPYLRFLDLDGTERAMKRVTEEIDHVLQRWLDEHKGKARLASDGAKKLGEVEDLDFMDLLVSNLDGDELQFSNHSVDTINKATCLSLVLAASDTTAITLTWTISLLLNNPNTLKKVQDELDAHVDRNKKVEESDIQNLEYLQAIIKESFRLYPAAPLAVPHESMEDCTIGGYHVPAGTRLFVNVSKIHKDPSVWENPDEFRPERFLTTHRHVDVRGQSFELLPFGSGRRMCPGITFALQVLHLTLAAIFPEGGYFKIVSPKRGPREINSLSGVGTKSHFFMRIWNARNRIIHCDFGPKSHGNMRFRSKIAWKHAISVCGLANRLQTKVAEIVATLCKARL